MFINVHAFVAPYHLLVHVGNKRDSGKKGSRHHCDIVKLKDLRQWRWEYKYGEKTSAGLQTIIFLRIFEYLLNEKNGQDMDQSFGILCSHPVSVLSEINREYV